MRRCIVPARAVFCAVALSVMAGVGGFGACAGSAGAAGAAGAAGSAGSARASEAADPSSSPPSPPGPGDVELTTALPGFTQAAPGAFNGPVSTATLITYTTDINVISEIEKGSVSAYLRCWSRPYDGRQGVLSDLVVKFPQATQTTAFLNGLKVALSAHSGVTTFAVKSPKGAEGYLAHGVIVAGSSDVAVSLGRGDFATLIVGATPEGNVPASQIELMAAAQWGALPGKGSDRSSSVVLPTRLPALLPASDLSSSGAGGLEALLVVVAVVVGAVVLVLWVGDMVGRRRRRGAGGGAGAGALDSGLGEGLGDAEDPNVGEGGVEATFPDPAAGRAGGEGVGA